MIVFKIVEIIEKFDNYFKTACALFYSHTLHIAQVFHYLTTINVHHKVNHRGCIFGKLYVHYCTYFPLQIVGMFS